MTQNSISKPKVTPMFVTTDRFSNAIPAATLEVVSDVLLAIGTAQLHAEALMQLLKEKGLEKEAEKRIESLYL